MLKLRLYKREVVKLLDNKKDISFFTEILCASQVFSNFLNTQFIHTYSLVEKEKKKMFRNCIP